jgi:hypothetical protein
MQEFREKSLRGVWWEPASPDKKYKGTLLLDDRNHGVLTLRGTERELASLPISAMRRTFFGRTEGRYIYEASIFNSGMESGPSRSATGDGDRETTAEYYTNEILIGSHVESIDDPFVNGVLLNLTGLAEWCDATSFSGRVELPTLNELATETVNLVFKGSASQHYDVGDGRLLRILSQYSGPFLFDRAKHVTVKEKNTIELVFSNSLSVKQVLREAHIWQTFFTLGLRSPSYIDEMMILIHDGGDKFTRMGLLVPGRRSESVDGRRRPSDILFTQLKLGEKIGERMKAWRARFDALDLPVLLFSGAAYQDAIYIHTNLLTYLQALEVLHREFFEVHRFPSPEARSATLAALRAAIPMILPEELRGELSDQLGFIGAPTLLDRLKQLYRLYPKSLGPLFRGGNADMTLLKEARNFLTHYGDRRFNQDFLWSRQIFLMKEKARLFIEICLLGAIGMTDDEILELVRQFEPYSYACHEIL